MHSKPRARVDEGLQRLLIGLGLVALGVGGVGVANVMVISVLERRTEIGLRRALGATRRHIGLQFLVESATLTTLGGITGASLGAAVTYLYARHQDWTVSIPTAVLGAAVAAALALGAAGRAVSRCSGGDDEPRRCRQADRLTCGRPIGSRWRPRWA